MSLTRVKGCVEGSVSPEPKFSSRHAAAENKINLRKCEEPKEIECSMIGSAIITQNTKSLPR